jgi:hypothetical protein
VSRSPAAGEAARALRGDHDAMLIRRTVPHLLVVVVLASVLLVAGCGSKSTSPVCTDVSALKSSISSLTDVKLDSSTLSTLSGKISQVQSDLTRLKTDAQTQYATQISAVDAAASAVQTTVSAAAATPNATTLAAAVTALQGLKTALSSLRSAVSSTC